MEWRMTRGGNILDPEIPIQETQRIQAFFGELLWQNFSHIFDKFNQILIMRLCNFNRIKLSDR